MTFDLDAFRLSVLNDPLARDIWDTKYRHKSPDGTAHEVTVNDTRRRVVDAIYKDDPSTEHLVRAQRLVQGGFLVPAGRINAGAGLDRAVTLMNCFLNEVVDDSMVGIQRAIMNAALTMQQGGGIGTDWSTVRPAGAVVKRTGSISSGVIPFMDQMDAMCQTVSSAGARRGAIFPSSRWDRRQRKKRGGADSPRSRMPMAMPKRWPRPPPCGHRARACCCTSAVRMRPERWRKISLFAASRCAEASCTGSSRRRSCRLRPSPP